jgi:hypothetical protein
MQDEDIGNAVAEAQQRIVLQRLRRDGMDPFVEGPALILAGLELLATLFRQPASPAERKLIQSHYPDATDATIDAHRLDRKGLLFVQQILVTAARKYLDHQPETAAVLDRMQSPDSLKRLVPIIARNVSNSFAASESLDASGYDISAAIIVNTVAQALDRGVAAQQLMTILYEGVERVIRHGSADGG